MRNPTQQQIWLGWEGVDLKSKYILCMCQVENKPPFPLSGHTSLTSALHRNGNTGRNWKAEGNVAEETGMNSYNKGIWLLNVEGRRVKLFVSPIDRSEVAPVPIDPTPIKHEAGERGKSAWLLDAVRHVES